MQNHHFFRSTRASRGTQIVAVKRKPPTPQTEDLRRSTDARSALVQHRRRGARRGGAR